MSKVSAKQTIALLTGAILATGVGAFWYSRHHKGDSTRNTIQEAAIDRAKIVQVLKELQKELFTVFQNFAAVAINISKQSMGRARAEDIKQIILEQPMFRNEIEQVEDMVYSQHQITKEQVQHYCQTVYREDNEIKQLQQNMKTSFDKAFQGIAPDPKTNIPDFLTAEKTFEILEKIMLESALKLNSKLQELQEQGEQLNFQSPKMMEVMASLKMDSAKKDILQEYGLNNFEDPGSKILQYATQQYSLKNKEFAGKMQQLDMKYQAIMEQLIMQGPMTHEELKRQMKTVPQQNIPFMGMPVPQSQLEEQSEELEQVESKQQEVHEDKKQEEVVQKQEEVVQSSEQQQESVEDHNSQNKQD